MFTFYNKKLL